MIVGVVYNEALAERVRAVLLSMPDVDEKKMFGGVTFMVSGQMCCGVLKDDLVVKTGPEGFDQLVAQPHVRPFDFSGRPMVGMVYVASAGVASDAQLRGWIQRGLDFVQQNPKTTAPRKARRK
ncbi:MAG: TfoX/Sxy family protein [Chloroflexi bacterium]|nr:TfoX/Sxy family protein [Chloroflexota bacterium]